MDIKTKFNDYRTLSIGLVGEKNYRKVHIDVSAILKEQPNSRFELVLQRKGDPMPYPVETRLDNGYLIWTVSDADVSVPGKAKAEIIVIANDVVAKSQIFDVNVEPSLTPAGDPPAPIEDWYIRILDASSRAEAAAESVRVYVLDAQTAAASAERSKSLAEAAAQAAEEAAEHIVTTAMLQETYDPQHKQTDIFAYADRKMAYYPLTCDGTHIQHDGVTLTYAEIKEKFDDESTFVYLTYQNLVYIPSIDVPRGTTAIAFSVDWSLTDHKEDYDVDRPYISRVIINNENVVRTVQISLENTDMKFDSFEEYDDWDDYLKANAYPNAIAVKELVDAKENKSTVVETTLLASNWTSDVYSFEATYPYAEYDLFLANPTSTCSDEAWDAYKAMEPSPIENVNAFMARGEVPTVDIPVIMKVTHK